MRTCRLGVDRAELKHHGVERVGDTGEGGLGAGDAGDEGNEVDEGQIYDWHGSVHTPIPRGRVRLSVVFAFADVDEELQ